MRPAECRRHLLDMPLDAFRTFCQEQEWPEYRARQIYEWVYAKDVDQFERMTNLSKQMREALAEQYEVFSSQEMRRQQSSDGTIKLLLQWPDGAASECVLIPDGQRNTACISSQVGCPVGCRFCASGLGGLQRQLTVGQIVEQAMRIRRLCTALPVASPASEPIETPDEPEEREEEQGNTIQIRRSIRKPVSAQQLESAGERADAPPPASRLSNIVFMGLGEPLANYNNLIGALKIINADWGMNIGARKITVSTVGMPSQIRRLADEKLQINLAISLHAPNDALRREIIPWADKIPMADLIDAGRHYFKQTGREVTIEYILLAGVNDRTQHAHELAGVCHKIRCNVNLLRYHPVAGLPFERPTATATHHFVETLRSRGVNAHVRRSRGMDIDAACGQLRRSTSAGS